MPRRRFTQLQSSTRRSGRSRPARTSAQIPHLNIARIACVAILLVVLLPSPKVFAQRFADSWNLHGPQQYSEGRSGTWLDPLRSDNHSTPMENDREKIREARADDEFDLSDFLIEPRRDLDDEEMTTPLVSRTQDLLSDEPEMVPPVPVFDDEPRLPAGSPMRQMTPEALFSDAPSVCSQAYTFQVLPKGLLYRTYLAGEKEPRIQFLHLYDTRSKRVVWDAVLGGRVGLLRYGTVGAARTEAFQLDLEGAVFARVLPTEPSSILEGSDYRVGLFGTWKFGRMAYKAGYYHISSHVGDEYLLAHPLFDRINYVRDSLLTGVSYDLSDSSRIYGEVGYAAGVQGGARPLELQAGTEYTPIARSSLRGAPFFAMNGHLREDFDFSGGVNVVSGWGWQGLETGHRIRVGLNYYNGPSLQYEFFDRRENLVGGGLWFDY